MNTSGIGLGLVISQKIVTNLDGEIFFESKENEGSTFTFTIKLERIAVEDNELKDPLSISQEEPHEEALDEFKANDDKLVYKWLPKMSQNIMMEVQYVNSMKDESSEDSEVSQSTVKIDCFFSLIKL